MNFRQSSEDLFESTRMSFGEHLEELRTTLLKCLAAIAVGCVIGFSFASQTVEYLKGPLVKAMAEFNSAEAADEMIARDGYVAPELVPWLEQEKLIPRRMNVDPGELVRALQSVIPDFGSKVNLNPYGFRASHFKPTELPKLSQRLLNRAGEPEPASSRLQEVWTRLTEPERLTIETTAAKTGDQITSEDADAVASAFDRLSQLSDLAQADAFAELLTERSSSWQDWLEPPKANPLAKMKQSLDREFDAVANQRLNRALLFGMFAEQLSELKTDLISIELWESADFEPQSLTVTEPFMIWMKAGLISGLVLALPVVMYFLWTFVASGLYPHEKKYVHIFLPISILLFVSGVTLAFFFVFEPVLGFLFSFNRQMGIAPQMRINDWLSFVMFLPLGFGIAFQLPLVMLFMNRINLFSVEAYLDKWRIAVMCIFVLSMILTPADPISMLLLAIPLTLLYFLGVGMCQWMPKNSNPFDATGRYTMESD
jgi:sec-independent protein translocase protein TatC